MHLTIFYFKSKKIIEDYVKKVDIKNRRVLLWNKNIWIKFSALKAVITKNERASVTKSNISVNELPKWQELSNYKKGGVK